MTHPTNTAILSDDEFRRAAFERRFPLPQGFEWSGGGYVDNTHNTRHSDLWVAWCAAWEERAVIEKLATTDAEPVAVMGVMPKTGHRFAHPGAVDKTDRQLRDESGAILHLLYDATALAAARQQGRNDRNLALSAAHQAGIEVAREEARAELAPAAPAQAEWMTCGTRRPWATNSLKARAEEMRAAGKRCRNAYRKDYMGVMARYVADAFDEAARAFEARLAAIDAARQPTQKEAT